MNIRIDLDVFNEVFIPIIQDYTHKFFIMVGSAGSGKSVAVAQRQIIKSVNVPNNRTLVVRNTLNSIRESCWKLIKEILSDWKLSSYVEINKSNYTITFPNGSEFVFSGVQDVERLKSLTSINDIWIEEGSEITGDDFDQLVLRARAKGKYTNQIILTTNPTSKASFIYKRWFEPGVVIPDDTVIHKSTYKNNKFLPDNYIRSLEALKITNPTYYKIYTLGEWTSLDKLVYNNWGLKSFTLDDVKTFKHIVGMDFGFVNDMSTIVDSYVDITNKQIFIYRSWGKTGYTNDAIARIIIDMGLSKSDIVADSAEPKSISELKKAGIYRIRASKKGPDSIIHGIQKLQQYQIFVNDNNDQLITEFENYSWKKDNKTGEYINEPIDQFNHFLDALRYSLQLLDYNTLQTIDRKLLF